MTIRADLPAIVFMKVGVHAGEPFEQILERKQREYSQAGRIFWGYGGGTMHPTTRVQPFAKSWIDRSAAGIRLVMQEIDSRHPLTKVCAREFSSDGVTWEPMPEGVEVRGSRYALVLGEIEAGDLDVALGNYEVGIGPSEGKRAVDYIRGRVDKGCLQAAQSPVDGEGGVIKIRHSALLAPPYAVLLR